MSRFVALFTYLHSFQKALIDYVSSYLSFLGSYLHDIGGLSYGRSYLATVFQRDSELTAGGFDFDRCFVYESRDIP